MAPGNSQGAVCLFDGGNPRIFTAKARVALSGGDIVMTSGAYALVNGSASSYSAGDVTVCLNSASTRFFGIALANVESGATVPVATRGAYLLKCCGSCFASTKVQTLDGGDADSVESITSGQVPTGLYADIAYAKPIGRCILPGVSGGFALVDIQG
jgi:hypothetical protein